MFIKKSLLLLAITMLFTQLSFSEDLTSDNYFEFSSGIEQTASFTHSQTVIDTNNPVKNRYYIGPGSMISIPFNFTFKVNPHYALGFNMSVELYHFETGFLIDTSYNSLKKNYTNYYYGYYLSPSYISIIPDINYKFNLVNKFISGNKSFISEIGIKFRLTSLSSLLINGYDSFLNNFLHIGPSVFLGYEVKTNKKFSYVIGGFFDIDFQNKTMYRYEISVDNFDNFDNYKYDIYETKVLEYSLYRVICKISRVSSKTI